MRDSIEVAGGGPMSSNEGTAPDVDVSKRPRSPGRPSRRAMDALPFLPMDCEDDVYPGVLDGRG